jgi:hypothetical protein
MLVIVISLSVEILLSNVYTCSHFIHSQDNLGQWIFAMLRGEYIKKMSLTKPPNMQHLFIENSLKSYLP